LDNSVEEHKTEEQLAELLWLSGSIEELLVTNWVDQERVSQVGTETLWRLVGHLDTILQNSNWEVWRWVRSQPQSEVPVANLGIWGQLLANLLESWHPRDSQVAVLEHHPVTRLLILTDSSFCLFSLTLTKGHWVNGLLLKVTELIQSVHGVRTWRQDENEWRD